MYVVDGIAYAGEMQRPLAVIDVRPLDDYKLWVLFSTGMDKVFDFAPLLERGAFQVLNTNFQCLGI